MCASVGFLALIAFEEADDGLHQLPAAPPPPPHAAAESASTGPSPLEAASRGPSVERPESAFERRRLSSLRHHCMLALLDQLDVLSLPAPSLHSDPAYLRGHLVHLLYGLPKGRLLLLRALLCLSPPHSTDLVYVLTSNLPALCSPAQPTQTDEQLAVAVADALYATPHATVNLTFAQLMMAPPSPTAPPSAAAALAGPPLSAAVASLLSVLRSRLGCMVVQVLLKKGQELHALWMGRAAAPLPPHHLAALSHDLGLWESLMAELVQRLEGRWVQALHGLPALSAPQPASLSSALPSSAAPVTVAASARAMWELLAQLLSHLCSPAPFAAPESEANGSASETEPSPSANDHADGPHSGAGRDPALYRRLMAELGPLFRAYLRSVYLGAAPEAAGASEAPAAPAPTASAAPASFAAAAAAAGTAPALLPALSPSLLFVASALLPSSSPDDVALLAQARAAQSASESAVRAFIQQKRQQKQTQQQQRFGHAQRGAYPPQTNAYSRPQAAPQQLHAFHAQPRLWQQSHPQHRSPQPRPSPTSSPAVAGSGSRAVPPSRAPLPVSAPGSYAFVAAQQHKVSLTASAPQSRPLAAAVAQK